jgi:hypothetical protein
MFDGVTSAAQSVQVGLAPAARMHYGAGHGSASAWAQLPMAARALVARTVARDDPAFAASRAAGGFVMRNRRHGLVVRFGCGGVSVRAAGGSLGLSLVGWGRAGSLVEVPAVLPRASANEVSYLRDGLREWYANGALGLEQGFPLCSPPPGAGSATAISGSLVVAGAESTTVNGNVEAGAVYVFGVPVLPHVPVSGIETGLVPTVVILEPGGVIEVLPGDAPGPPLVINEDKPGEDETGDGGKDKNPL